MIKEGILNNVDEIYGIHNASWIDEGSIKCKVGTILAGAAFVKITVKGKGGHGSFPEKVSDVITAGCQIHSNLHTIKSRNIESS